MEELINEINALKLGSIKLLALITTTSADVVFYAPVNGTLCQSNAMAEKGLLNPLEVDEFYKKVASIIRNHHSFKSDKLNIVKVNGLSISINYEEKSCHVYQIKKVWKESLLSK